MKAALLALIFVLFAFHSLAVSGSCTHSKGETIGITSSFLFVIECPIEGATDKKKRSVSIQSVFPTGTPRSGSGRTNMTIYDDNGDNKVDRVRIIEHGSDGSISKRLTMYRGDETQKNLFSGLREDLNGDSEACKKLHRPIGSNEMGIYVEGVGCEKTGFYPISGSDESALKLLKLADELVVHSTSGVSYRKFAARVDEIMHVGLFYVPDSYLYPESNVLGGGTASKPGTRSR